MMVLVAIMRSDTIGEQFMESLTHCLARDCCAIQIVSIKRVSSAARRGMSLISMCSCSA